MARPVVFLEVTGSDEYPRYFITTNEGKYWNGKEWKDSRREGHLYLDGQEASGIVLRLQRRSYKSCKHRRKFVVPIELEVLSDVPVPMEILRLWVQRAVVTNIAYGTVGNGPVNDSIVLAQVNYAKLKEDTDESGTDRKD